MQIICDNETLNLKWYHIKSLDPFINEEIKVIKLLIPDFINGWLYDECLNGFLEILTKNQTNNNKCGYIPTYIPQIIMAHNRKNAFNNNYIKNT